MFQSTDRVPREERMMHRMETTAGELGNFALHFFFCKEREAKRREGDIAAAIGSENQCLVFRMLNNGYRNDFLKTNEKKKKKTHTNETKKSK